MSYETLAPLASPGCLDYRCVSTLGGQFLKVEALLVEEVPMSVLEGRVEHYKQNMTSINLVPSKAWRTGSQMAVSRLQNARSAWKWLWAGVSDRKEGHKEGLERSGTGSSGVEEQSQGFSGVPVLAIPQTQALTARKLCGLGRTRQAPVAFSETVLVSQSSHASVQGP